MKSSRRFRRARSQAYSAMECLEQRTLLTGNVLASVTAAGNLLIRGDSQANQIGVQSSSGSLQVSSLDGTTTINGGAGPFTANVTGSVFIFIGGGNDVVKIGGASPTTIAKNLLIDTGNGSDTVQVANTAIDGSVWILGERGSDTVSVGSAATASAVTVGGDLDILGGCGDSTIAVFDAAITGNLLVIGNGANDHIQVGYDAGLGLIGVAEDATGHVDVGGNLTIRDLGGCDCGFGCGFDFGLGPGLGIFGIANCFKGDDRSLATVVGCLSGLFGGGFDCDATFLFGSCGFFTGKCTTTNGEHVAVADVNVGGNLKIRTGCGNDEVLVGAAHTPSTDTNPTVTNLVFGDVTVGGDFHIGTDSGNDTIATIGVSVMGATRINAGAGNDHIAVVESTGAFHGDFTIDTGSGNDAVVLTDSDAFLGKVTINLGRGNDTVWLASDFFQQSVTINGGAGNDTFLQSTSTFPNNFAGGAPTLNSIETNLPDVTPSDPVVVAAFSWFTTLLGV